MRVEWSPLALERAEHIVECIRREHTGAAWRWTQQLLARVNALTRNAARGFGVGELDHRARIGEIVYAPFRVIYRIDPDRIIILTLRAAASARSTARSSPSRRVSR